MGVAPQTHSIDDAGVTFDPGALGQLAYHVRWSAALAAAGHGERVAPHAIIAGTILEVLGGEPLKAAVAALDLPDAGSEHDSASATAHREAAMQLGQQLVSHFTSDGRGDLADLYQEVTRTINATL